jgi:phospholipid N-methyltransferase
MADLVRRSPGARYLGIERDPEFTGLLQQRFPGLVFVCADARDVASICRDVGCDRMRAVVSGLPFVRMRPADVTALLERTHALLGPDGIFRNFTYAHTLVTPGSVRLRRELKRIFDDYELRGPILRNLPPAVVMSARKRRACASRPSG